MTDRDISSIFTRERQRFTHYVRSLRSDSGAVDAEDIVQDVLLKVLERSDLPAPEALAAYIYRSLRNRVIDHARTKKPLVSLDAEHPRGPNGESASLASMLQDNAPHLVDVLHTEEGKRDLFEALEQLSDIEREVIISHELEGVPFKELTQILQMPQNTLLSHKSRAMRKLRQHFLASNLASTLDTTLDTSGSN